MIGFGFDRAGVDPYYTRPMSQGRSSSSAEVVDAMLLAARGATVDRTFELRELPRLDEWSAGEDAKLSVRFYMADRRVGIEGRASAKLKLTCQRCLGAMVAPVDDEFHVVIADSEAEMDRLSEQEEAIIADPTRLDLSWLLEEQLLLAMPLVPVHEDVAMCAPASVKTQANSGAKRSKSAVAEESQRPFANLRDLMAASDKK